LADKRSPQLTVEALRSGARGIFYRSGSIEQLQKCIRVVSAGQIWADNEDLQALLDGLQTTVWVQPIDAKGNELLSNRQKQLVSLVIDGLKNREIATRLDISEHTVRNYLFRIFDKLGVSSRAELIVYAIRNSANLF
jgi:DNA-binding NarL/FixJ family response regulator